MIVSRGFPQGSGLSPLLFNIIRRLPQHCISSALQFADDTTLATADPSLSAQRLYCKHEQKLLVLRGQTLTVMAILVWQTDADESHKCY